MGLPCVGRAIPVLIAAMQCHASSPKISLDVAVTLRALVSTGASDAQTAEAFDASSGWRALCRFLREPPTFPPSSEGDEGEPESAGVDFFGEPTSRHAFVLASSLCDIIALTTAGATRKWSPQARSIVHRRWAEAGVFSAIAAALRNFAPTSSPRDVIDREASAAPEFMSVEVPRGLAAAAREAWGPASEEHRDHHLSRRVFRVRPEGAASTIQLTFPQVAKPGFAVFNAACAALTELLPSVTRTGVLPAPPVHLELVKLLQRVVDGVDGARGVLEPLRHDSIQSSPRRAGVRLDRPPHLLSSLSEDDAAVAVKAREVLALLTAGREPVGCLAGCSCAVQ
jgi:hypothetical protein